MVWHFNKNSARANAKIYSESLARVPVNSKGRINDISALVQEVFRYIPDPYYRLERPSRQEYGLMFLCSQKREHELNAVHIHLNIVHEEHKIVTLVATESIVLGRYVSFLSSSMKFPKARKLLYFVLRKVCFLFLSFIDMNLKILLCLYVKET